MPEVRVVRLEPFPDLDDEVVFPRLSEKKLHWLGKKCAERRTFAEGDAFLARLLTQEAVSEP